MRARRRRLILAAHGQVADSQEEINSHLDSKVYETKTLGERHLPASRVYAPAGRRCWAHRAARVGEGVYELLMHHSSVHLVYVLTAPAEPGPLQQEMNISKVAHAALAAPA